MTPARREQIRGRLVVVAVKVRLARVDRLIEAGRGREARRVMAAIGRDMRNQQARLDAL